MDIKYLSDGKKVVVIGQLNNVESIVQEVFVTEGGDEIPSGEKFTTKNVHDEPVVSWKAKEEANHEARLQRTKSEIDKAEREMSGVQTKLKGLRAIFKQATLLSENFEGQSLDTLVAVMSGSCEFLVVEGYGMPEMVKFGDALIDHDDYGRFESLKLMSLMGRSDGDVSYRLNRYGDGSGSYSAVHPCSSEEEARSIIEGIVLSKIDAGRFPDINELNKLHKIGITFSGKMKKKIKARVASGHSTSIENQNTAHENLMQRIDEETKVLDAALSQ